MAQQFPFNTGRVFYVDPVTLTPLEVAYLQDLNLDIDATPKFLGGMNRIDEIAAFGKGKITGKATTADIYPAAVNLMTGNLGTVTTGQYVTAQEVAQLSSGTTSYTVTQSGANYFKDLGVDNNTTPSTKFPVQRYTAGLPAVGTVTATTANSGGTIVAGTYFVRCAALNSAAAAGVTMNNQQASLTIPGTGVTAATTQVSAGTITSTGVINASVPAVAGAAGYAWFAGLTGAATLQIYTAGPSVTLTAIVAGGSAGPASDTTTSISTGQYQLDGVTSGKYNFSAADGTANSTMLVKYLYQLSTGGRIITLNNAAMQQAIYFSLLLSGTLTNKAGQPQQMNVWLNACVSSKLALGWKIEDKVAA